MGDIRTKNINAVDRRPVQHDLRRHSQFPETRVPAGVLTGSVEGTRITQGILVASAVLLESSEVGVPLPGRGDVLVQVGAASVHPGDYFVMTQPVRMLPRPAATPAADRSSRKKNR